MTGTSPHPGGRMAWPHAETSSLTFTQPTKQQTYPKTTAHRCYAWAAAIPPPHGRGGISIHDIYIYYGIMVHNVI